MTNAAQDARLGTDVEPGPLSEEEQTGSSG
jgi:hypothetical protein